MEDGMLTFNKFELIGVGGLWNNKHLQSKETNSLEKQHEPKTGEPCGPMQPKLHEPELPSHQDSKPHNSEPEIEPNPCVPGSTKHKSNKYPEPRSHKDRIEE
jgi:hypothetical protein